MKTAAYRLFTTLAILIAVTTTSHAGERAFAEIRRFEVPEAKQGVAVDSAAFFAISNRVNMCIPRFIVISQETILARRIVERGLGGTRSTTGGGVLLARRPIGKQHQNLQLDAMKSHLRPSGTITRMPGNIRSRSVSGTR